MQRPERKEATGTTPDAQSGRNNLSPFLRLLEAEAQNLGVVQAIFPHPLRQHFMLPEHWLST